MRYFLRFRFEHINFMTCPQRVLRHQPLSGRFCALCSGGHDFDADEGTGSFSRDMSSSFYLNDFVTALLDSLPEPPPSPPPLCVSPFRLTASSEIAAGRYCILTLTLSRWPLNSFLVLRSRRLEVLCYRHFLGALRCYITKYSNGLSWRRIFGELLA